MFENFGNKNIISNYQLESMDQNHIYNLQANI